MNKFVVRLKEGGDSNRYIGSGVLYYDESLGNEVYVITAAHCLFKNPEKFADLRQCVVVDIHKPGVNEWVSCAVDTGDGHAVHGYSRETDYAVLTIDRQLVVDALGCLPDISIAHDIAEADDFVAIGYPVATNHQSQLSISARRSAVTDNSAVFTLSVLDDITADYVQGYSGGGIFARIGSEWFMTGVFSRFLAEERGRMIYAVGLEGLNSLIKAARRNEIKMAYPAPGGMTQAVMARLLSSAKDNLGPNITTGFTVPVMAMKTMYAVQNHPKFIGSVRTVVDRWLNKWSSRPKTDKDPVLGKAYDRFMAVRKEVADIINSCPFSTDSPLDMEYLAAVINAAVDDIRNYASEVSELNTYYCRSMAATCGELLYDLQAEHIALSTSPQLLIMGEAGCGKSHLMAVVAENCLNDGVPAMLFHGRDFDSNQSVEENILRMLGARCGFEPLMESLDSIGCRIGRRVLLMIDAINDTEAKSYWRDKLPAFVKAMSVYRGVGLVMTLRSTYKRDTLPDGYDEEDSPLVVYNHTGFAGSEQQALDAFCIRYGLRAPAFPLLSPEFANPLFLNIACQVASEGKSNGIFPNNMHFDRIFIEYPHILDKRFDRLRDGEYDGLQVASQAIRAIAGYMVINSTDRIEYKECHKLIRSEVGSYRHLLVDLISDCLLSRYPASDGSHNEYVGFTYQRMSDYYKAEQLVDGCRTAVDVKARFADKDTIDRLRAGYDTDGIVEQLAIILPERYGLEFWEVLPDRGAGLRIGPWQRPAIFMNSLRWRSAASVDKEKCLNFLCEEEYAQYFDWLDTILRVATIEGHPFNADHFHSKMVQFSPMARRDSLLQPFFLDKYDPEPGSDSSVRRLVDWAWTPGISAKVSADTARLAATAMMWFLTASDMALRDRTTKALVNLLQHQPDALLAVMEEVVKIDDTYLRERMYAVAYACALRNGEPATVERIARFVYRSFFEGGVKETHLLMRDYAACTIDYAHSLGLLEDITPDEVHPPYGATMPALPDATTIKHHKMEKQDRDSHDRAHNAIFYSLVDGLANFGHKTVKPNVGLFCDCSFVLEDELMTMRKSLNSYRRKQFDDYTRLKAYKIEFDKLKNPNPHQEMLYRMLSDVLPCQRSKLGKVIGADALYRLDNILIPNHLNKGKSAYDAPLDHMGIRYWILERVFELGYDSKIHGDFDETLMTEFYTYYHSERHGGRIERIGKKYQRIAMMEIFGRLADNYYLSSHDRKPVLYQGPWQRNFRDCDPVSIVRVADENTESWCRGDLRLDWDLPVSDWLDNMPANPQVYNTIERRDPNGRLWLTVYDYRTEREPQKLELDRYNKSYGIVNIQIKAHIIRKQDKKRIIRDIENKNIFALDIVETAPEYSHTFLREKHWSRCWRYEQAEAHNVWEPLYHGSKLKARSPIERISGNMEDDNSGTGRNGYMPARFLMDRMHLQWDSDDMSFVDGTGKKVFTGHPSRCENALMAADDLLPALSDAGLDIVWTVFFEKIYIRKDMDCNRRIPVPSGVFYYDDNGALTGHLNMFDR